MTLSEASPYPRSVIRSIAAIACLALSGCVTDVVSRAEHAELLSSVRALRAENARLENRLNKLEQDKVMASASRPGGATAKVAAVPTTKPAPSSNDALPPLTVVKLKPRKDAAPKIETAVEVSEPPETFA